ncbi:MAG: hypothetical protein H0W83_14045, partial [Planctomycetes bacterium]|nr:hypothetical protein [Planctomycetota bacterium]
IRAMPPLAKVPIVVFSGTCSPEDHAAGLQVGATEIARKPGSYREYLDFVRRLTRFWASSQRLPRPVAMIGGAPSGS